MASVSASPAREIGDGERAAPSGRGERFRARTAVLIGIAGTILIGGAVAHVMSDRQLTFDHAAADVQNLTIALEYHAMQEMGAIDQALQSMQFEWPSGDVADLSARQQLHEALARRMATATGVVAYIALSPEGRLVASNNTATTPLVDFTTRPFYRALAGPPVSDGLYVEPPRIGAAAPVLGQPMLNLARAIRHPDGSLAGIVVGALSIEYLDILFKQFQIGPNGIVQLYREDGILVAQSSGLPEDFGRSFADSAAFRAFEEETPVPAIYPGPDGVRRLYSSRCLEALGLVVVVGRAEADIEGQWLHTQATPLLILIAALVFAVPLTIFALRAEARRRRLKAGALERLARMARASTEIASTGTAAELLQRTTRLSRNLIGARRGVARIAGPDGAASGLRHGDAPGDAEGADMRADDDILRTVEATRRPLRHEGADGAPHRPGGLLAVPVLSREGAALGSILLSGSEHGVFDAADEAVLVQIAQIVSTALERMISVDQLAVAAAAAERNRYEIERVLTSTSDGVYTLDGEDRFNFMNPQARRMLRLDGAPIGQILWEVFPGLEGSQMFREYRRVRASGTPRRFDLEHWGRHFSVSASPLGDGLSVFFRDVTEQRHVEEQLRQAQKMEAVGQLTGGIAHDFNNLLTVMLGNAVLLSTHPETGPTARRLAATIRIAAQKGADLTSHLLAFAREQPLRPSAVDIASRIRELLPLLLRTLSPSIEIRLVFPGHPVTALVDANRLDAALLNLAINARDAMPAGGDLVIDAGTASLDLEGGARAIGLDPGRYARIAISDTGTGIPREILPKIFDPFFTTKPPGKGTGLGLSMVYGFARQSGGTVVARSEEGKGSTITLYIPLSSRQGPGPADAALAASLDGTGQSILIVDDDPLVREHAGVVSTALGYIPTVAETAEAALDLMRAGHRFDLLFTDVVMPGPFPGPALAAAATAIQPDLLVIFASGHIGDASGRYGALPPGSTLLTKPYDVDTLARAFARAFADGTGHAKDRDVE